MQRSLIQQCFWIKRYQPIALQTLMRYYISHIENEDEIVKLNKQGMKGVAKPIIDKKELKKELEEEIPDIDLRYEYNRYHTEEAVDKATGINSTENIRIKMNMKHVEEKEEEGNTF